MTTLKTESEAWTAIADTLKATREMPLLGSCWPASGLCIIASMLFLDGLISREIYNQMDMRTKAALKKGPTYCPPDDHFLVKPYAWRPRIAIARRFAKEAKNDKYRSD